MKFQTPDSFTNSFPKYVYRSQKGVATVQWRQAALDMANDRAKLVEALKALHAESPNQTVAGNNARTLLRELGEDK